MTSRNTEPSKGGQPQQDEVGNGDRIDPTKNVLDLVKAESKYQDGMRDAIERIFNTQLAGLSTLHLSLSAAETRRINELANTRQFYETRIADMLKTSVESTSTLVSNQLVQIQNTFNERVAKLEQFRYESTGRTSVADPALADALGQMARSIAALKTTNSVGEGRSKGFQDVWGWFIGLMGIGGGAIIALLNK